MYNKNINLFIFGGRRISSGNIEKLSSLGGGTHSALKGEGENTILFSTLYHHFGHWKRNFQRKNICTLKGKFDMPLEKKSRNLPRGCFSTMTLNAK